MILKEFTLEVPGKGGVNVSFYLHFDERAASVGEIIIRPDFQSSLPHRAWLKKDGDIWKLFDEHPNTANSEIEVQPEFLDDEISNAIAQRILAMKALEEA